MNYSVRCRRDHALRCVSAVCENWSSVRNGFRDPLRPVNSGRSSLSTGDGHVKVHASFCDLDATVELFKASDSNDCNDVGEGYDGDGSSGDSGVNSSPVHSAGDSRKSFASDWFCCRHPDNNYVMLDSEISVKLRSRPPLNDVGHNSSLSQSRCGEVGSMFVTTAVSSECVAVNQEVSVVHTEHMEYSALKLSQVPVSVSSTVCDVDRFSVAETDISEEIILLGDDDGIVTSSDCITSSDHYSNDISMKNVGHSGDEGHVSFDADETLTYTHPSNGDVLGETESDIVSTSTINDENDKFVANKPASEVGSVVSSVTMDCIQAGNSDLLITKTSSDTVFAKAVSHEIERLVSGQHSIATKTAESTTVVDICNNNIRAGSHGDAELSAYAVSHKNDGFVTEKPACGTETVDTTTFIQNENGDDLVETNHNTLSNSDMECENDTLVVENSASIVEHSSPADEPDKPDECGFLCDVALSNSDMEFENDTLVVENSASIVEHSSPSDEPDKPDECGFSCDVTPDVDTAMVVDDEGQTIGLSPANSTVNVCTNSGRESDSFVTVKPTKTTVSTTR